MLMDGSDPLFSVIIPVYNREALVLRAIRSARAQTFSDYEILVVDDASTDGTCQVARAEEGPDLRVIRLEVNQGVAGARNAGAAEARGEYLVFLDSDDELLPDILNAYTSHLRRWRGVELFWCGIQRMVEERSGDVVIGNSRIVSANSFIPGQENRAFPARLGSCCGLALQRRAFLSMGGFDSNFRQREDHEFFIRALTSGLAYASLDDVYLLKHLHHGHRLMGVTQTKGNKEELIENQEKLISKHEVLLQLPENREMALRLYTVLVGWCYESDAYRKARMHARQTLELSMWNWKLIKRIIKYEFRAILGHFRPLGRSSGFLDEGL